MLRIKRNLPASLAGTRRCRGRWFSKCTLASSKYNHRFSQPPLMRPLVHSLGTFHGLAVQMNGLHKSHILFVIYTQIRSAAVFITYKVYTKHLQEKMTAIAQSELKKDIVTQLFEMTYCLNLAFLV